MMPITAQMHDGTRLEFPDGTDPAVIQRTVQGLIAQRSQTAGAEKSSRGVSGMAGDLLAGAVRGAGEIGATILQPIDAAARAVGVQNGWIGRTDRREAMTRAARELGADTDSTAFQVGKVGAEIAGTAGLPGGLVRAARAVAPALTAAPKVVNLLQAVETGGASGGNLLTRAAGGAVAGSAQAALVDPESTLGGAIGGAVGGPAISAAVNKLAPVGVQLAQRLGLARGGAATTGAASSQEVDRQIMAALDSITKEAGRQPMLAPEALNGMRADITQALAAGKKLDASALARKTLAGQYLGADAGLTLGQATRDPQQYAKELNLRGITGVGEPMQARMGAQNAALISRLRGEGALPDAYEAAGTVLPALRQIDASKAAEVSAAYKAFRDTGGTADVPMGALIDQYGKTLADFGEENIPSAIRKRIEGYLSSDLAKQQKVFDLEGANRLLTQLNQHYDPSKPAQQAALGQIKSALRAVVDQADAPEGAGLLKTAIGKARERFNLHDAVPALKDAAIDNGPAREELLKKYVTGGSVDEVAALSRLLPADAMEAVRGAVRREILAKAAPGAEYGRETATLSQAALRREIDRIGMRKLQALMGPDEAGRLADLQQVAEWVQKDPVGAVVSRGTHVSTIANLLQSVPGGGVIGEAAKGVRALAQKAAARKGVENALASQVPSAPLPKILPPTYQARIAELRKLNLLAGPLAGQTEPTSSRRRENQLAR